MDELSTLISVISKNKLKQIEIIGNGKASDTQLQQLYEGIASGKFTSEDEAREFFFARGEHSRTYWNRLKRKLTDRLLSNLFLIDVNQPNFTEFQRAYYTCFRDLVAVKILLGHYARKAAIPVAEKTLKIATKFEFSEIALELAKVLRLHYGSIVGDRNRFKKYNELVKTFSSIQIAEIKAEEYFSELMVNYVNSFSNKVEFLGLAELYSKELRKVIQNFQSYRLNLNAYLIFAMRYEIAGDHENVIKISKEALTYFRRKKHLASPTAVFNFQVRILVSLIPLGKYKEAEIWANKCLELPPKGSNNWFLTLNYYLILCFHANQWQKAYSIYEKAVSHPNFPQQYQNISENWRIHEAFIFYFIAIGKINPGKDNKLRKFRLSKFLNEVPTFAKDKSGGNITILILQILFLLRDGKFGEIIDRMEPLKTYNHRYLRRDETFRSHCFIKMLLLLPQNSFHRAAVLRKADKFWKKLQSVPLARAAQSSEMEIVPYEVLWNYIMELLDDRFH